MKETTIFYATGNSGKFEYAKKQLSKLLPDIELRQLDIELPEQQTHDLEQIAREKAQAAWETSRYPTLCDDASIYFHAYPHFPGLMTKFIYHSLQSEGIMKLLDENNKATRKLFLAYCDHKTQPPQIFTGETTGKMIHPSKPIPEKTKLPYDYMFIPSGQSKTFKEIKEDLEQEKYSYRHKALSAFAQWYTSNR